MTIQINVGDHTSSQADYIAVPNGARLQMTRWARTHALWIARNMLRADIYFQGLPGGRTLTELLDDNSIWINFGHALSVFGEAVISGTELAIGPQAYRMGRWTVVATLIHELAHIDGVPGGADLRAEGALLHTGLGYQSERTTGVDNPNTPYDPGIQG